MIESRRGRSGPTISLFSFQDIITSVTAIVTVVTLLLALDLVNRKQSQSQDSSANMAMELVKRLERAEAELARLQAVAEVTDEFIQDVAATSPAELRNEIAQRESRIVELDQEKSRLKQQTERWELQVKQKLAERFDLEPMKKDLAEIELRITEIESRRAEELAEKRPIFSLPRGMLQDGWIAEIDGKQISVAPIERAAVPVTFVATGLPLLGSSAADNFANWIERQSLSSSYFLVLVRPGSETEFYQVEKMLDGKSISHGFDLVDADQTILHPERGAAP